MINNGIGYNAFSRSFGLFIQTGNALAIDNPVEYARLYLDGTMQMWIDAEDSSELW